MSSSESHSSILLPCDLEAGIKCDKQLWCDCFEYDDLIFLLAPIGAFAVSSWVERKIRAEANYTWGGLRNSKRLYSKAPLSYILLILPYVSVLALCLWLQIQFERYYVISTYASILAVSTSCLILFFHIGYNSGLAWKTENFRWTHQSRAGFAICAILIFLVNLLLIGWCEDLLSLYLLFVSYNLGIQFAVINLMDVRAPALNHDVLLTLQRNDTFLQFQHYSYRKIIKSVMLILQRFSLGLLFCFGAIAQYGVIESEMGWLMAASFVFTDFAVTILKLTGIPLDLQTTNICTLASRVIMGGGTTYTTYFACFSLNFLMYMGLLVYYTVDQLHPTINKTKYLDYIYQVNDGRVSGFDLPDDPRFGIVIMLVVYLSYNAAELYCAYKEIDIELFSEIHIGDYVFRQYEIALLSVTVLVFCGTFLYFARVLSLDDIKPTKHVIKALLIFIAGSGISLSVTALDILNVWEADYELFQIITIPIVSLLCALLMATSYMLFLLWSRNDYRWNNWLFKKQVLEY